MSKRVGIQVLALLFSNVLYSQKPPIDSSVFDKWRDLNVKAIGITDDGHYILHQFNNDLVVQSTDTKWKKSFVNSDHNYPQFTQDNASVVFQATDSVVIAGLGNERIDYIKGIESKIDFQHYGATDNLLLYHSKNEPARFFIKSLATGVQHSFDAPEAYWYNEKKGSFLFLMKEKKDSLIRYHLTSYDWNEAKESDVWEGPLISKLVFNEGGSAYSFMASDSNGVSAIWYADITNQHPVMLIDDHSASVEAGLKIADLTGFDKLSGQLFLMLSGTNTTIRKIPAGVDVYSYKDARLQSAQLGYLPNVSLYYTATINITDRKLLKLEDDYTKLNREGAYGNSKWVLMGEVDKKYHVYYWYASGALGSTIQEWNWNKKGYISLYLLSLKDGSRRYVAHDLPVVKATQYFLSPGEEYVIFYDADKEAYFNYEIETGLIKKITGNSQVRWWNAETKYNKYSPWGIAGFTHDGKHVLVNDQYDIYKLDISGKEPPVNITAGYGKAHHIVFRIEGNQYDARRSLTLIRDRVILSAINSDTKESGFYGIDAGNSNKPDFSLMRLYPSKFNISVKAQHADAYLVMQQSEHSFPNVYFSKDLQQFTAISNIHPEKDYNWLTSELVNYKLPDGRPCQAALYKPENFDPHKKYPMIILYYEVKTNSLHEFEYPEATGAEINIPFYVSNGYLVLTPDIHYTIGYPGRSALNSVVSAVNELSKRPYVDMKKIGLNGHSFGSFETDYIVTHSNLFAAACSSAGITDMLSFGGLLWGGDNGIGYPEVGQGRIGASIWEKPGLYLENSPILRADKVTTPLLMVANKNDPKAFAQGIAFFGGLRRLNKKVWMLQYDGQGHILNGAGPTNDYTIRGFQFFNYYLKNMPPPKWMTEGVPTEQKRMFSGMELDYSGARP